VDCYSVSPHGFYLMIYFKIVFVDFIFLILNWLRITIVAFLTKHCELLQCFSILFFLFMIFFCSFVFFLIIFSKIIFVDFIFLILNWLRKLCSFFFKNTLDCYSVSPHGFFLIIFSKLSVNFIFLISMDWYSVYLHEFFFFWFFSKLYLSILFF